MSGFELLGIIRRRFPQIPVIAMSGEYMGTDLPTGVIADAYLQKGGEHSPEVLVGKIRELLEHSPLRGNIVNPSNAPVWIPLNGKQYFVLTCPNCLRSFSLPTPNDLEHNLSRKSRCEFCDAEVAYVLDAEAIANARRSVQ
jgi:CheY-like chemotaxis protein